MKPALCEVICDTSTLQYLHQLGLLELLRRLAARILVTPAVVAELQIGRANSFNVPETEKFTWIEVVSPKSPLTGQWSADLGPGEQSVLALALERPGAVALLDDDFARHTARAAGIAVKGTLGLLLEAKRQGLVPAVSPLIERLAQLGFRLSSRTRKSVLQLANEE